MTHDPAFIAYAVTVKHGRKSVWRRIGVAFPCKQGLAVTLNALPLGGRVVLLDPNRPTAQFFPPAVPADLATKPALRGERRVWQALRRASFPAGTRIFYNRAPKGCRRRADMLILIPERGIVAIEVKGGCVQFGGGLRQQLADQPWRKRIEPWHQAQRALAQALTALELNPIAIPQAFMFAIPDTSAGALPFPAPPHMLTSEDLAPSRLARKIATLLPRLDAASAAQLWPTLDSIAATLAHSYDKPSS